jgi:branched-chain amino acid transport system substrate-binding protein
LSVFQTNYYKRFGIEPDVFAAHAYDGMNLIIGAINKAGLNRVLIRDVLTDLKTFQNYPGITGKIIFDDTWNDIGDIWMAEVRQGKFEFSPAPPMDPKNKVSSKTGNY